MRRLFNLTFAIILFTTASTVIWLAGPASADNESPAKIESVTEPAQGDVLLKVTQLKEPIATSGPQLNELVEQMRQQAAELMKSGRKALAQQIRANAEQLADQLAADEQTAGTTNEVKIVVGSEHNATEQPIARDRELAELLRQAAESYQKIRTYETTLKDAENNPTLKTARRELAEKLAEIESRIDGRHPIHLRNISQETVNVVVDDEFPEGEELRSPRRPRRVRIIEAADMFGARNSEVPALRRKIEHLRIAADNLDQASLKEQARELRRQAEQLQEEMVMHVKIIEQQTREMNGRKERDAKDRLLLARRAHGPDRVPEALQDLRREVHELRNEIREMHKLLEQHIKQGGRDDDDDEKKQDAQQTSLPTNRQFIESADAY